MDTPKVRVLVEGNDIGYCVRVNGVKVFEARALWTVQKISLTIINSFEAVGIPPEQIGVHGEVERIEDGVLK